MRHDLPVLLAARAALIALALVACAWFALGAHQAHEVSTATNIVSSPPLTHDQVRQARSALSSASALNPDRIVGVLRARLDADQRRYGAARGELARVVGAEPENLQAWIYLARFSYGAPVTFARAVDRIKQLLRTVPASG